MRIIDKKNYLESVKVQFLLLPSYRRFPNDAEFMKEFTTRDLYNMPRRLYLLRKLENYGRKEFVPVSQYTIEHIMPQNPDLSKAWKEELGPDWERIQETWLHTIGNLTLTGYNSEYSDKPFIDKRGMKDGFKDSPIKLNQSLRETEKWNEEAIIERANSLGCEALKVWEAPRVSKEVLAKYSPKPKSKDSYSIDSYDFLSRKSIYFVEDIRNLFDALRKEILAIDPVVTEEYLKLYIAYKAETNFVDIVPQMKRLRLSLNMKFRDIEDPKNICRDVSNIGRWGNGDVDVGISSKEEIPYIMSLIRQAYASQMSDLDSVIE